MSRRRNSIRKNCCSDVLTHLLRLRFTPEELEQRDKSRKIDKFLEKDKNSFRRQVSNFPVFFLPPHHHDDSLFFLLFHIFIIVATERTIAREPQLFIVYTFLKLSISRDMFCIFLGEITSIRSW